MWLPHNVVKGIFKDNYSFCNQYEWPTLSLQQSSLSVSEMNTICNLGEALVTYKGSRCRWQDEEKTHRLLSYYRVIVADLRQG